MIFCMEKVIWKPGKRCSCKIVTEKHTVNLPLRVNWGGGWSDTPPICCEMGGTVLNAAVSLNGELPVEVTLIKIPEKKIVFDRGIIGGLIRHRSMKEF